MIGFPPACPVGHSLVYQKAIDSDSCFSPKISPVQLAGLFFWFARTLPGSRGQFSLKWPYPPSRLGARSEGIRMGKFFAISIAGLAFCASAASAEPVVLNHLDCRFDETAQTLVCPEIIPTGRAATVAVSAPAAAPVKVGKPEQGTAEWNEACAAKYNSFDPATGNYRSYSGQTKPCRIY